MADEAVARGHPSWREGLDRSAPVWVLAAAALALLILLPLGWLRYMSVSQRARSHPGPLRARVHRSATAEGALEHGVLAFWSGLAAVAIGAPMACSPPAPTCRVAADTEPRHGLLREPPFLAPSRGSCSRARMPDISTSSTGASPAPKPRS